MNNTLYLGVILAGGMSSRVGQNKAFLELGKKQLIMHIFHNIHRQIQDRMHRIIISCATHNANDFYHFSQENKIECVIDQPDIANNGPLSGIFSALHYAQSLNQKGEHYQAIITMAIDTPFFPDSYIETMINTSLCFPGKPIIATIPATTPISWHPTFALWPLSLQESLAQYLQSNQKNGHEKNGHEKKTVKGFAMQHHGVACPFPLDPFSIDPFFNINRVDELAIAEQYLLNRQKLE